MGLFFEDAAIVLADAFEYAIAVEQAVVVGADLDLGLWDQGSIEPD